MTAGDAPSILASRRWRELSYVPAFDGERGRAVAAANPSDPLLAAANVATTHRAVMGQGPHGGWPVAAVPSTPTLLPPPTTIPFPPPLPWSFSPSPLPCRSSHDSCDRGNAAGAVAGTCPPHAWESPHHRHL